MSCARRLGCTALLFWKERMLRADNTTVIVLALQERGGPPIPMHRDEIVVDMTTGMDHVPFPGTTYNTCVVPQVSAISLLHPPHAACMCVYRLNHFEKKEINIIILTHIAICRPELLCSSTIFQIFVHI